MADILDNYKYPLSLEQMRKIFFICSTIAKSLGIDREEFRHQMKILFCERENIEYFSCSPYEPDKLERKYADKFIDFLMEFAFKNGIVIPTKD